MKMFPLAPEKSNLYINVAPQEPWVNRIPWSYLEGQVGCFMNRNSGYIVTGTCSSSMGTIGNGIQVPSCFWKLICYKRDDKVEINLEKYFSSSLTA